MSRYFIPKRPPMATDGSQTLWMGDPKPAKRGCYRPYDPERISRALEPYMDEFFVLQAFEQMGEPAKNINLIHNKYTGLPMGYCFVDFNDPASAQRAMLRLNGKTIPNSLPPLRFKLNYNNMRDNPNKKEFSLFVGELSDDVDDYALFQAFSKKYPTCYSAKVVQDHRGVSKGFGFVRFSEETEQQKALIEMQHTNSVGRKTIRVSLATPKKQHSTQEQQPPAPAGTQYSSHYANYNKQYGDYAAYYQQYYAQYYASQAQPAVPSYSDDQNLLEEPELEVDVKAYNDDYMIQSEEIFDALEDSRWHPMDQWNSTVPATAR